MTHHMWWNLLHKIPSRWFNSHIQVWTKWLALSRWHFEMDFQEWAIWILPMIFMNESVRNENHQWIYSQMSKKCIHSKSYIIFIFLHNISCFEMTQTKCQSLISPLLPRTAYCNFSDSKVHGANMGAIWGQQDPSGPHVGHVSLAIWELVSWCHTNVGPWHYGIIACANSLCNV